MSPGKDITSALKSKSLREVRSAGGSYGNRAGMTDRKLSGMGSLTVWDKHVKQRNSEETAWLVGAELELRPKVLWHHSLTWAILVNSETHFWAANGKLTTASHLTGEREIWGRWGSEQGPRNKMNEIKKMLADFFSSPKFEKQSSIGL